MSGFFRRGAVLGLCLLITVGTHSPVSAAAPAPSAGPETAARGGAVATSPVSPLISTGTVQPSLSTSYSLVPQQFSLEVSPTRLVIGESDLAKVQYFQVVNRGQSPSSITVQKRDFVAKADGTLEYQRDAPYAASQWITVSPLTFTISPGQTQVVTAKVKVPENPDTGDHQVALVFLVPAGKTAANIKINRGVATPIFISVHGPQTNTVMLQGFQVKHFVTGGPVTLTAQVKNTGTVHRDFRGKSPLAVSTAGTVAPFPDFTVLRGAVRDVSSTWDPPLMCICHPSLSIQNADGTSSSISVQVVVFPLMLAIIVLAVLILLALFLYSRRRRSRRNGPRHELQTAGKASGGSA